MDRLKDKVAVVTGGGTGIGRAICLEFAREGAHVVVVSNVEREAESVALEVRNLGVEGVAFTVDVTDSARVNEMAANVAHRLGNVDILVTSAGVMGERCPLTQTTDDGWRRTIEVNLNASFYCIRAFLPQMLERKAGRVITISSVSGKLPAALNADYAASKHGVIGLSKALALELGLLGASQITVNAICPGATATPMVDSINEHMAPLLGLSVDEFKKKMVETKNIQKRVLDPAEIASMAVYLASDEGRGVTGQALNVCGGTVLC